jgi:hypothetical protein
MNAQWGDQHSLRGGERVREDSVFQENTRLYVLRHPDVRLRPTNPRNNLRRCLPDARVGDAVFLDVDLFSNRHKVHHSKMTQSSNPLRALLYIQ